MDIKSEAPADKHPPIIHANARTDSGAAAMHGMVYACAHLLSRYFRIAAAAGVVVGFTGGVWLAYQLVTRASLDYRERLELTKSLRHWRDNAVRAVVAKPRPLPANYNPAPLIRFDSAISLKQKRRDLVAFLFPGSGALPLHEYPQIESVEGTPPLLTNFKRAFALRHVQRFGIETVTLLYGPKSKPTCLLIYHAGHKGDTSSFVELFDGALGHSCYVATMHMPLEMNGGTHPLVNDPALGPIRIRGHNDFQLLDGLPDFNPLSLFVRPVVQVVNYAREELGISSITMAGFSGGGWTAALAAATDPRISRSVSVAGGQPTYLRTNPALIRPFPADYELANGRLLRIANMVEQFTLASAPGQRRFAQILAFEADLFDGAYAWPYEIAIQKFIKGCQCGGQFSVVLDFSALDHKFTVRAERAVLSYLFGQ